MPDLHIVILAAGKGTRMMSSLPKVLHRVAGRPMIEYVLRTADRLSPRTRTLVVGHMAGALRQALSGTDGVTFVTQEPQLGTGHALLQAEPVLRRASGSVLLLSGDAPRRRRPPRS
jgi:bifunctional N-acetylglucosamine-1-phosphate-uridyltransferase/glucosamine-1-phosphate-acetyltransferase GlmU-like protein